MKYKREKQYRLRGYDYSFPGLYFVTICVKNFRKDFGVIKNGMMFLSDMGSIVWRVWDSLPHHHPVRLYEFVVMPNHVHGVLEILDDDRRNIARYVPTEKTFSQVTPRSLPSIIRSFKSECTRQARKQKFVNFKWQSRFHDHVIRNEKSLAKIQDYIQTNILKWEFDKFYSGAEW